MRLPLSCLVFLLSSACGGSQDKTELPPARPAPLTPSQAAEKDGKANSAAASSPGLPWAASTYSPRPGSTPEPLLERAEAACGSGDSALHEVAQLVADLHAKDGHAPNLDITKFHLHRLGAPYVMPRLWSASMSTVDESVVAKSVDEWARARPPLGEFRCGLGLSEGKGGEKVVTAIQVDVLAELRPLPTRVESGTWLDFESTLLAPTSSATVLLLPPVGPPRHLHTTLEDGVAKARFSIETEGTWLVQLMATQEGGPRPVAQLYITADRTPPSSIDESPVPGEKAFDDSLPSDDALFSLLNEAREDEGLPLVKRNRKLDRLAEEHCRRMVEQGRISHDTGAGHPAHRIELAGLHPKAAGENVALAGSVVRLHRVLWASPAHRENLLLRRWDEAGVAIVDDGKGALYATQLFIDSD
jgi:uncharacterized protein YkwD